MPYSLNVGINQKQTQKLVMTQSLKQAIELLQLSTVELSERISQEIVDNPIIDEEVPDQAIEGPDAQALVSDFEDKFGASEEELNEREEEFLALSDVSDSGYTNLEDEDRKRKYFENAVATPESLADHLLWQARMAVIDAADLACSESIITSLDDNGFLPMPLDEFAKSINTSPERVAATKALIQLFDPLGCASADVAECLLVQARHYFPDDSVFHAIISGHFEDLEKLNYEKIARELSITTADVVEKGKALQSFDPFPGRQFSTKEIRFIIPDIDVKIVDGEIIVTLNDDWIPHIRINAYYKNMIKQKDCDKSVKSYIQEKIQSATNLMKNISTRRDTIIKVVTAIMNHQREFLTRGPGRLKPLTHIDIAQEIDMHESTVSRVTSNKFVQTPWGVFELKYFFVSRLKTNMADEDQSSDVAMKLIKDIIAHEDPQKALSDEDIVAMLEKTGIQIARRTIAKYRGILRIPSSSQRRKLHKYK